MSGIAYPIDADTTSGAPSFTGQDGRNAFAALMQPITGRPNGAASGIRPGNDPTVTVTASQWTVSPFTATADPGTALTVGPYLVAFTANETGTITAADATYGRIDRLDVQVPDDPPGSDPRNAVIVYTAGVAASSPTAPAAPARSFPRGTISGPKAGTGSPSFSKAWPYAVASGGVLPCASSAFYPSSPYVGQTVYDVALDTMLTWDGAAWSVPSLPSYYREATFSLSSVANNTYTTVTGFATVKEILGGQAGPWSGGGVFTAPADDGYTFTIYTVGIVGAARTTARIMLNGNEIGGNDTTNGGAGRITVATVERWLSAGDQVTFQVFQNSGSAAAMSGTITARRGF